MTIDHRKLVALTTENTPYTEFITSTDGYQVTDTVTRYTKSVYLIGGPTPPTPDPLEIADGQGANWVNTNVYEVGQTIEGRTAAYTGGVDPVTYRYRFQFKATGSDSWVSESWTNTTNAKNSVFYTLTETGQVKLQSQARDSSDPVVELNSTTGIKTVVAAPIETTIGDLSFTLNGVSIDPNALQEVVTNNTNTISVAISGDATPTYTWAVKTGSGSITGSGNTISFTGTADGSCRISVVVTAPNATDSPKEQSIVFLSSPAPVGPVAALELNFANSLSLVDSVSGNNLVTFSRASTGTYVGSDGLIKTSRTNHCLYSNIDSTNWTQAGASSLAVSSVPAPYGGTCYDLTTDNGGPNSIRRSLTSAPVGTSVLSVFARFPNAGFTALNIRDYSAGGGASFYADYVPATDSWNGQSNCVGLPSEDLGNGWKRLTVVSTSTSSDGNNEIRIAGGINSGSFTQQTCQVWGIQLEDGPTASAYIPTQGVPNGAPRFDHDPSTGTSLGLLIEESRTNYAENSQDFTLWTTLGSTVLTAQGIAPDGTNTAFKIQEDTGDSGHFIREPTNSTWTGVAILSCYVKPAGRNFVYMGFTGVSQTSATFDLVNKVSAYSGSRVVSASVEDAGNGWLRIISIYDGVNTTGRFTVGPAEEDAGSGLSYLGDGSSGILAWGAQLEVGSFQTSLIPTSTSAVTRAADVASITGTDFSTWYNQSEGTVFVDMANSSNSWMGANLYGSGSDRIIVKGAANNALQYQTVGSGSNGDIVSADNVRDGEPIKYAYSYKPNDYAFCVRGDLDTNTANPQPVVNNMEIGAESTWSAGRGCNCPIARITYYSTRITDQQLIDLTS